MRNVAIYFIRLPLVRAIVLFACVSGPLAARPAKAQSSLPNAPEPVPTKDSAWAPPIRDNTVFKHVLFDQLEDRASTSGNLLRWDAQGWIGTDMNRLWVKSEGFAGNGTVSDGDHEVLYDRPIPRTRYFDAQVGVRADLDSDPSRVWAAIGIEGLAPYRFQLAPTFYIRNDGHVAGRIDADYDRFFVTAAYTSAAG